MIAANAYYPAAFPHYQQPTLIQPVLPMLAPAPVAVVTPAGSPQMASGMVATHHHLAHLASTVLASLHGLADHPRRALRRRIHRLLVAAELHPACVMLALYYLRRASQLPAGASEPTAAATAAYASCTPEMQLLAGLVVAQKWNEDAAYTNRTWAELILEWYQPADGSFVHISDPDLLLRSATADVTTVERAMLARLAWDLRVDHREFTNWCDRLGRWASNHPTAQQQAESRSSCAQAFAPAAAALAALQQQQLLLQQQQQEQQRRAMLAVHAAVPRPWSPAYGTYSTVAPVTAVFAYGVPQQQQPTMFVHGMPSPDAYAALQQQQQQQLRAFLPNGLWAVPSA